MNIDKKTLLRIIFTKETLWFLSLTLFAYLLFWFLLSLQMLGWTLWPIGGGDSGIRATIAAISGIGPGKAQILHYGSIGLTVAVVGLYLVLLGRPGRLMRTVLLFIFLPIVGASYTWIDAARYYHEQGVRTMAYRFTFHELSAGEWQNLFLRETVSQGRDFDNFKVYAAALDEQFDRHKDDLSNVWGIKQPDVLRAFFYLSHVSGLWGSGDPNHPQGLGPNGCVLSAAGISSQKASFATYWNAPNGCCTDYMTLMSALFDHARIENRAIPLVEKPVGVGHWFNEAKLNGEWWVLDANIGVAYSRSWSAMLQMPTIEKVDAYLFPHPGLNPANEALYRPYLGSFRMMMINRTAARNMDFYEYVEDIIVEQSFSEEFLTTPSQKEK